MAFITIGDYRRRSDGKNRGGINGIRQTVLSAEQVWDGVVELIHEVQVKRRFLIAL